MNAALEIPVKLPTRRNSPSEKGTNPMPQNQLTGAAGNAFGRDTAPKIARAIGATMSRPGSNEAHWKGRRVVIKCAKYGNNRVGVTYQMIETVDAILAAFQRSDGRFEMFELDPQTYQRTMIETRSTGPSAGKVGQVSRATFQSLGKHLGAVSV